MDALNRAASSAAVRDEAADEASASISPAGLAPETHAPPEPLSEPPPEIVGDETAAGQAETHVQGTSAAGRSYIQAQGGQSEMSDTPDPAYCADHWEGAFRG